MARRIRAREVLRLRPVNGLSMNAIARTAHVSKHSVQDVPEAARGAGRLLGGRRGDVRGGGLRTAVSGALGSAPGFIWMRPWARSCTVRSGFIWTGSTCGSVSVWYASNERTPGSTSASVTNCNTVGANSRYSVVLGRANAQRRLGSSIFSIPFDGIN